MGKLDPTISQHVAKLCKKQPLLITWQTTDENNQAGGFRHPPSMTGKRIVLYLSPACLLSTVSQRRLLRVGLRARPALRLAAANRCHHERNHSRWRRREGGYGYTNPSLERCRQAAVSPAAAGEAGAAVASPPPRQCAASARHGEVAGAARRRRRQRNPSSSPWAASARAARPPPHRVTRDANFR